MLVTPQLNALEAELLLSRAKAKSPGFAAVLGFFFPWADAFYNGKAVAGLLLLVVDIVFLALSFIGIGIPCLLLYGFWGAYMNYKWATQTNQRGLEQIVAAQKAAAQPHRQQPVLSPQNPALPTLPSEAILPSTVAIRKSDTPSGAPATADDGGGASTIGERIQ